jgi:uncharacterized membrane protein
MIIASPHFLWLLVLAPALAWVGWKARSGGHRRRLVAVLRGICLASLILAIARPMLRTHHETRTKVLAIDMGPTMPGQAIAGALKRYQDGAAGVRVVAFSNRAEVVTDPLLLQDANQLAALRARLDRPVASDDLKEGGSVVAAAIQLAGSQISLEGSGEIELVTNGLSTRGDAEAEAYRLATHGIALKVVPAAVEVKSGATLVVGRVTAPSTGKVGQTVPVDVELESTGTGQAQVTLTGGQKQVSTVAAFAPGVTSVRLLLPLGGPGLTAVTAGVSVENNRASEPVTTAIEVLPASRVLLVRQPGDSATAAALGRLLGRSAAVDSVSPAELTASDIDACGAVVIADVPADSLPPAAQQHIRGAVLNGTGLLLTGAARSFGPGGYQDSPLARLLPVNMPQQAENIDPSTTLVLIIDTSGSMDEFQRIDLAKEIAHLAISHLKPHDKVGIVEFYGGKRWALPIQSAGNVAVINRALGRLTAGGSTLLYPAVEEAAFALESVQTQSKHVMIISDGGVESAPFAPLFRQMNDQGIALSSVAVSPTPGEPNLMPDFARWGGGRYYSVPDRFALPDITLKQPQMSLLSPVVRTPAKLVAGDDAMLRSSDVTGWPPIDGYVRTVARPTADVLLRTTDGDPLLVRWRYGSGFVAALPTQLGSQMTRQLQGQPGFAQLVTDLFRQIESDRQWSLQVRPLVRPAGTEVQIDALDSDPLVVNGTLTLSVGDAAGKTLRTVTAEPLGPGSWNVLLPGLTAGLYSLDAGINGTVARGRAGVAITGPRALPRLTTDHDFLRRVARFADLTAAHDAPLRSAGESFFDLRAALVTLAVLILLTEVAARRLPGRGN